MIDENRGGYLVNPMKTEDFTRSIRSIMDNCIEFGEYNKNKALMFEQDLINLQVKQIYSACGTAETK